MDFGSSFTVFAVLIAVASSLVIAVISGFTAFRRWIGSNAESQRRAHVAELAKLQYRWKASFTRDPMWRGGVFGKGEDRTARDILYGQYKGRPVVCFQYQWVQRADDQEQVYTRMIGAAWIGGAIPLIDVSREAMIANLPGDTLLESAEFNDRFRLSSHSREAAIHVMDARMVEYLVSLRDRAPEFWMENGWVLVHAPVIKGEGASDQLQRLISQPVSIASRVPAWVLKEYGGGLTDPATRNPQDTVKTLIPGVEHALPFPRRESFSSVLAEVVANAFRSSARNASDAWTIFN